MSNAKIKELEAVVAKLQAERQGHVDAIAEIDSAFEELGIEADEAPRRKGKKPGPKPGAKRRGPKPGRKKPGPKPGSKRKKKPGPKPKKKAGRKGNTGKRYAESGTAMILRLISGSGAKGIAGADLDKAWKKQGRAGSAYNTLTALSKAKKIKKQKNKEGRGSMYTAA